MIALQDSLGVCVRGPGVRLLAAVMLLPGEQGPWKASNIECLVVDKLCVGMSYLA